MTTLLLRSPSPLPMHSKSFTGSRRGSTDEFDASSDDALSQQLASYFDLK